MNGHTATPWQVGRTLHTPQTKEWPAWAWEKNEHQERLGIYRNFRAEDQGTSRIVIAKAIPDALGSQEEAEANAAFIVRAANSHAALVEALRAVEWVGLLMGDHTCEMCPQCWSHKQGGHAPDCQLDKALRAAEGD